MALTELDYDASALPDNSTFRVCEQVSHGPDGTLLVAKGITGGITAYANAGWAKPSGTYTVIHSVSGINTDNCNVLVGDCVRFGASTFLFTVCGKINSTYQNAAVYVVDNTGSVIHTHSFGTGAGRPGGIVATSSTTAYVTIIDSGGIEVYKTADSGATWNLQGTIVSGTFTMCRSGLVKVGSTFTALIYDISNSKIVAYTSTDDCATWTSGVTLPDSGSVAQANPNTNTIADSVPPTAQFYSSTLWVMGYWKFSTTKVRLAISQDGGATWSAVDVATAGGTATVSVYVVHSTHFLVHYSDDDGTIDGVYDQPHATETYDRGTTWAAIPTITHAPASTLGAVYQAKITASQAATSGLDGGIHSAYTGFSAVSSTVPAAFGATYPLTGTNPDVVATTAESAGFDAAVSYRVTTAESPGFDANTGYRITTAESAGFDSVTSFPYAFSKSDTVSLTQSIGLGVQVAKSVTDTIPLSDSVNGFTPKFVSESLALSDAAAFNLVVNKSAADTVSLSDQANVNKVIAKSDSDTLSLTQSIADNLALGESDADNLAVTQSISEDVVKQNIDAIPLVDSVGLGLVIHLSIVDDVDLTDDAISIGGAIPLGSCEDTNFSHLEKREIFTFECAAPALTVDLPRLPEFSNTQETSWGREIRRTLSGQFSMAQGAWPIIDVLRWKFRFLSQSKRDDIEDFLVQTTGLEITVIDQENTTWTGVILNEEIEFKPEGIGCQWSFEIDFRVTSRSVE